MVLGRWRGDYLRHDGPEHVLCFAPTRSGKGVGLVVPTLLTWPGSAIVHDIKGENWTLTAGWRARFGRVLLFDPTNARAPPTIPLLEVRRGEWEVRDVQNIADILVDPEGALERRNHWEKTSHSLLVGAILHVLYAEAGQDARRRRQLPLRSYAPDRDDAAGDDDDAASRRSRACIPSSPAPRANSSTRARTSAPACCRPRCRSSASIAIPSSRRSRADATGASAIWSKETRPPRSTWSCRRPTSAAPSRSCGLILNQIGRRLTEELESKGRRHRLLLMLDEFPALGRLDFFESALAFMAGYGLKSFLIAQSLNQIEKAYGQNNSILDNCHVRVSFATNDERTAKRVSDALGTATEMRAMKNYAGHRLSPWLGHLDGVAAGDGAAAADARAR